MDFLQSTLGKVVTAALALAVIAGGIGWWQLGGEGRAAVLSGVGRGLAWLLVVLALPWAGFAVIGRVARLDSNAAGFALVGALTAAEFVGLLALFGWDFGGAVGWGFAAAAAVVAGAYNTLACDWIAEKLV